jgi:flagellar protein FliO/FliZ
MQELGPTGLLTAAAALLGVLGALVLLLRGLRASGFARAGKRLAVEEAVAIDGRRRLVLARCDGRSLLLLTGGTQDQVIGWLPKDGAEDGPRA